MRALSLYDHGKRLAELIIQNQQQRLFAPPEEPLKIPTVKPFPTPYQSKTVDAGATETVYEWVLPANTVAFIQFVGNNMYEDVYLYWYIDKVLVIEPYINWQISPINTPKPISPWLRVEDKIIWKAKNESDVSCLIEVLTDGFFVPVEDVKILREMGLPVTLR